MRKENLLHTAVGYCFTG